jgi:hypothetical protein
VSPLAGPVSVTLVLLPSDADEVAAEYVVGSEEQISTLSASDTTVVKPLS